MLVRSGEERDRMIQDVSTVSKSAFHCTICNLTWLAVDRICPVCKSRKENIELRIDNIEWALCAATTEEEKNELAEEIKKLNKELENMEGNTL